jgi:hypothetical protein
MLKDSKPKPRHIKLDMQAGPPGVKMLEQMKQQALSNAGSTVELPFGDETTKMSLTVCREMAKGTWSWMLYRNDGFSSGLEWSHATHDTNYIDMLVTNSTTACFMMQSTTGNLSPIKAPETIQDLSKARKAMLEGDLKNIQVANLLQSVSMGQMTGRLEITSSSDTARVYFDFGKPTHATLRGTEGHEALIQVFALDSGTFTFYDEPVGSVPTTITRGLTGLMMEGAAFADHTIYLRQAGMSNEAYPIHAREMPPEELPEFLKHGVECDMKLLQAIYQRINGTSNWADILRDISLQKTQWVPILFNLTNSGLIRFDTTPITGGTNQKWFANRIDWSVTQAVENSLKRADTGLYTYATLLYSLQQELYRFEEYELPFSLIIFGYTLKDAPVVANAPPSFIPFKARAITELRDKVFRTKRRYDLLCHYGAFSYAILLPITVKTNAQRAAEILGETCATIVITDEYPANAIEFRAGLANIPEDCKSLDELIALAEMRDFSNPHRS